MTLRLVLVLAAALAANDGIAFLDAEPAIAQATLPVPRQAEVQERGVTVMPFDQARTMHMFQQSPTGGTQTVLSTDGDPAQIAAIRSHLRHEAANFASGDYSDPTAIHGAQMPGLAILTAADGVVRVTYEALPEGARMTFTTKDPIALQALQEWFTAQLSDHGSHAMMIR